MKLERPCVYNKLFYDSVPYGSTYVNMPGSECIYDGDKDISNVDCCDNKCPAYKPEPIDNRPFHIVRRDGKTLCGRPIEGLRFDYYPTCKQCLKKQEINQ